ncbi:MAG TPA: hypothetical protein VGL59_01060, partial [Polyangia bacterium]
MIVLDQREVDNYSDAEMVIAPLPGVRSRPAAYHVSLGVACLLLSACASGSDGRSAGGDAALVGTFETYVVDQADGSHREEYALKLDAGQHVELVFAEG